MTERRRGQGHRFPKGYVPWNKGLSYTMEKRTVYANRGAWMQAMKRRYGDRCMVCGWDKAPCDAHHIIAKASGGQHSIENGVLLCPNCHRLVAIGLITLEQIREAVVSAAVVNPSV